MPSLGRYRISLVVLVTALAVTSGTSVYLYELRQNDLNNSVSQSANLDKQISDLNNQIAALRVQIDQMQHGSGPDSQDSLKAQIAQLTVTINSLRATNASQALEIQTLQAQIQALQNQLNSLTNPIILNGAGATFPLPLLSSVTASYTQAHAGVQINYQSVGSGAGILDLTEKLIDFAATDMPLSPVQQQSMPGPVLTIPETVGAVAIAYNIPGIPTGLKLNASVATMIFQGNITQWNDRALASLNPTLTLPNARITVVHRSDSSGTSFIFTSWLSTGNSNFPWKLGISKTPNWQYGRASYLSIPFNAGEAGAIQQNSDTIGYVELNYVLSTTPMTYADLLNGDDNGYVRPSLQTSAYAVNNSTGSLPAGDGDWSGVSLLNAHGANSYPMVSFSYIVVYKELNILSDMTLEKAKALVGFLWFTVHNGQVLATPLAYVPLSASVTAIDEASIESMTFNGQTLPT